MKSPADELAKAYARLQSAANRSGRALHDDVAPSLSAAGLHLQLLASDHPRLTEEIARVGAILEQAFERIRVVSQELAPSPVLRGGLKNALERLAESAAAAHPGIAVKLRFNSSAQIPAEAACAVYEAASAAVAAALGSRGTTRVAIVASGARGISLRVSDNGSARGRATALAAPLGIARAQGLLVTLTTKQDTIVHIRYAL